MLDVGAAPREDVIMGKARAIVTIVRDEAVFFPIWLRYYGQFFDPRDIYVFDHASTDGSTEVDGFVREPVTHDTVDHKWMRKTIQAKQNELIEHYDVVMVSDVDEIIAPNPELYGTLGDFIDDFDEEFVNCHGYEILHHHDTEPPIDLERPILQQRQWWFWNYAYSKPLISSVPMDWYDGFHARRDGRGNFEYDLRLIHLHRMDFGLCQARHRYRSSVEWSGRDVDSKSGYQNRIAEGEQFEKWFYTDSCTPMAINQEQIPPVWRTVA